MTRHLATRTQNRHKLPLLLEPCEPRLLLSAAPPLPSPPSLAPLAFLPNESTLANPKFSDLWHLQNTGQTLSNAVGGPATGIAGADIDAVRAWDLTTGQRSVIVAVLDTGVDRNHPDLQANLWQNTADPLDGFDNDANGLPDDIHGWNFIDNNNNVQDAVGHGTSVAGVIGAVGNNNLGIAGVAWNVQILPVKVGTIAGVASNDLISGINYVVGLKERGWDVVAINASFIDFSIPTAAEIAAIRRAADAGILYVNAAGNTGTDINALGFLGGWSSLPNVLTVAATDNRDNLASFSNFGSNVVHLGAPGVDILTTTPLNSYSVVSGTSYAAPMVAGTVALMASFSPTADVAQIRNAILASVDPVAALQGRTVTGGRLNVLDAMETLVGNQAPFGNVDSITAAGVSGWAYDFNNGRNPVTVEIHVDGQLKTTAIADQPRPDLTEQLGDPNHAFTATLGGLTAGTHTVEVFALDYIGPNTPSGTKTLLKSQQITVVPAAISVTQNGQNVANGAAVDFGAQLINQTPPTRTFTVSNPGAQPLTLGTVAVPAGFTITDNLVTTLAPGATDTLRIQLDSSTTGYKAGNVTFTTSIPGTATFTMAVSGMVGDDFVSRLYRDILGREPDEAGLNSWNQQIINQALTPLQISAGFLNSREYRINQISRLYQNILGRPADAAGLSGWLSFFEAGGTIEEMSSGFYGSQEYYNNHGATNPTVIQAWYQDILNRPVDAGGLNYWIAQLNSGLRRDLAAWQILRSQEGRENTVRGLYVTYLGREPDQQGLDNWSTALINGTSETDIIIGFVGSAEYFVR